MVQSATRLRGFARAALLGALALGGIALVSPSAEANDMRTHGAPVYRSHQPPASHFAVPARPRSHYGHERHHRHHHWDQRRGWDRGR